MVLSFDPDAMKAPLGEKATEEISWEWCADMVSVLCRVCESHTRIFPSKDAETRRELQGE
jgi:hypothetical protein